MILTPLSLLADLYKFTAPDGSVYYDDKSNGGKFTKIISTATDNNKNKNKSGKKQKIYGPIYVQNLIKSTNYIKSRCSTHISEKCLYYIMLAEKSRAKIISSGEQQIYGIYISEYERISK